MLVGYARKDGINAARAVLMYLGELKPDVSGLEKVSAKIKSLPKPVVSGEDIQRLEVAEAQEAEKKGLEEYKFASNEEMLRAMGLLDSEN